MYKKLLFFLSLIFLVIGSSNANTLYYDGDGSLMDYVTIYTEYGLIEPKTITFVDKTTSASNCLLKSEIPNEALYNDIYCVVKPIGKPCTRICHLMYYTGGDVKINYNLDGIRCGYKYKGSYISLTYKNITVSAKNSDTNAIWDYY